MERTKMIKGVLHREIPLSRGGTFWVASFVNSADGPVNLLDLTEAQQKRVGAEINVKMLNALYEGVAEFRVKAEA